MSLFLMSLLGGGGRGSKQIKPMSLYILFFLLMASLRKMYVTMCHSSLTFYDKQAQEDRWKTTTFNLYGDASSVVASQ